MLDHCILHRPIPPRRCAFASPVPLSQLSSLGGPSQVLFVAHSRTAQRIAARSRRVNLIAEANVTGVEGADVHVHGGSGPQRFPDALRDYRLSSGVRARTVVHVCRAGTLCTSSTKHDGVPFGTHVDFILDEAGRPIFLLAEAALHTKNIEKEPRVSLYCQPPSAAGQDGCRVTLVGSIERMSDEGADEMRDEYIDVHGHAADALAYPDLFAFHRMEVWDVYFVGGFGVVSQWVDPGEFARSEPDPLAYDAPLMMADINKDRQEDLQRLCEVYLGVEGVGKCTMMGLDRLGFDLRVRTHEGEIREYRVGFRERVRTRFDCHSALVKVFQEAWERQNGHAEMWEAEGARPAVMYFALK